MRKAIQPIFLLFFVAVVFSQGPERPGSGKMPPKEELRKRIDIIRMWKLVEELELSEEQSMRFFPIMTAHDAAMSGFRDEMNRYLDILSAQMESGKPDENELNAALDMLVSLKRREFEEELAFYEQIGSILSRQQQAELLLFRRHFDEEVRCLIESGLGGEKRWPKPVCPMAK